MGASFLFYWRESMISPYGPLDFFMGFTSFPIVGSIFAWCSISEVPCHRTKQKPTQGQSFLCSQLPGIPTQAWRPELFSACRFHHVIKRNGMTSTDDQRDRRSRMIFYIPLTPLGTRLSTCVNVVSHKTSFHVTVVFPIIWIRNTLH